MTARKTKHYRLPLLCLSATCGAALLSIAAAVATVHAAPPSPRPDANASREAFLQVYKVFISPRCQNCHPAGDSPLQGDDSHQTTNLSGEHMPPGNPKWSLPSADHKMVFVGRSPAELCRQLKDPKQTGGRSLQQLLEHVSSDDLVGWAWDPGTGRTPPPLSRAETVAQMKNWIAGGAACPQ